MLKISRLTIAATVLAVVSATSPAGADPFGIVSLNTTGAAIIDHDSVTNDDRGGIAVSTSRVFYTGDSVTGRFALADLTGGASTGARYDSLAGNIKTGDVYVFGEGTFPATGGDTADRLLVINGSTGALTGGSIMLSTPISFPLDIRTGIFSGSDRIVVVASHVAYSIALPSGTVTNLGAITPLSAYTCESWFYWGVAEEMNSQIYVAYRDLIAHRIVRTRLSTGTTTLVSAFTHLSDMCSFTVSTSLNRWYFHYEGTSQFGGSFETVGYANAVFTATFPDGDGDGIPNLADNCPSDSNADQLDGDDDFVGDVCDPCPTDPDVDGDLACEEDNCPLESNPGQEDADDDGYGDVCDDCPGPGTIDTDSDGTCNGFDNCSVANPDQADLDSDGSGDLCDDIDNELELRSGSMKVKPSGLGATVKGSIVQLEPFFDAPDASEGLYLEFYDQAFTYLELSFTAEECDTNSSRILCETADNSSSLQIKLKQESQGKVTFTLKMKTLVGGPPYFLGPLTLRIADVATSVNREGNAGLCSTSPAKISCR